MFGNKKRIEEQLKRCVAAIEQAEKRAYLVDVNRSGRVNKFLFARNGELIEIETMGLISDDLPGWKERLLR